MPSDHDINGHSYSKNPEPEPLLVDISNFLHFSKKYLAAVALGGFIGLIIGREISRILPKTYQSTALAEFIPFPMAQVLKPLETETPQITKKASEPYLVISNSQGVKNLTNQKLTQKGIDPGAVALSVGDISNTNFLAFRAQSKNPEILQTAATLWEESAIEYLIQLSLKNSKTGRTSLDNQYENNKKILADLQQEIEKIQPELDLKNSELKIKNDRMLVYALELEQIKLALGDAQITLPVLKEEIKKHNRVGPFNARDKKSEGASVPAYGIHFEKGDEKEGIKMLTYGANPLYADLERKITDADLLVQTLPKKQKQLELLYAQTQKEIVQLNTSITEMSVKSASLKRDIDIAQKEYALLNNTLGPSRLSDLGLVNLRHVSPPTQPAPLPNKKPVLAGLILGALLGFLIQYFRHSGQWSKNTASIYLKKTERQDPGQILKPRVPSAL